MGKGREKGQSYRRRTNAQIEADKRKEDSEREKNKSRFIGLLTVTGSRSPDVATVSNGLPPLTSVRTNVTYLATVSNGLQEMRNPSPSMVMESYGIRVHSQWRQELPVNYLKGIPPLFWEKVGPLVNNIRRDLKSKKSWPTIMKENKFGDGLDYVWNDPVLMINPGPIDFLVRSFCRLRFFLPDKQMSHHLLDGIMPCP